MRPLGAAFVLLLVVLWGVGVPSSAQEEHLIRVRADFLRVDRARNQAYARGNVVVTSGDLTVEAEEVLLDLEAGELVARGRVVLREAGQTITADQLTYNFRTRVGSLDQARTRWLDPRALEPIQLRARRLDGNLRQRVCLHDAELTTCDLDNPTAPYKLNAEEMELIPQDKIVLRNASLILFGRRVLTLPFFVLFLREPRQQRILPVVGWNEAEGWFLKTSTTYFVNDQHYGFVYLDWMERVGMGVGVEHIWRYDRGEGDYFVYGLANRQTGGTDLRLRLAHRHDFGSGWAVGGFWNVFRRQEAGGWVTENLYTSADVLYRDAEQTGNLFTTYARSNAGLSHSELLSARVLYERALNLQVRGRLDVPYSQNVSTAGADLEATPRLDLSYVGPDFTVQLVAEHRFDLDGDGFPDDRFYSLSRLPELVIAGFARPLAWGEASLMFQGMAGLGYFLERNVLRPEGSVGDVGAARLDLQGLLSGIWAITPSTTVDGRLSLRGSYYTTGDVRGVATVGVNVTHRFSEAWSGRLSYNFQDRLGTTPFLFDRELTQIHNVLFGLTYRTGVFGAELAGGLNFRTSLLDPVILRVDWLPFPDWLVTAAASVDPVLGQLQSAELAVRARLSTQWEVGYRAAYSPTGGVVVHDEVRVTYYDGCWATSATYFGARQEFWMEVWLTAFPGYRGAVGLGQTGVLFQQPFLPPSPVR